MVPVRLILAAPLPPRKFPSPDGKLVSRAAVLDFFWAKHKMYPASAGLENARALAPAGNAAGGCYGSGRDGPRVRSRVFRYCADFRELRTRELKKKSSDLVIDNVEYGFVDVWVRTPYFTVLSLSLHCSPLAGLPFASRRLDRLFCSGQDLTVAPLER